LVFYRNILLYVKLRNNKMKKEFKLSDEEIIKKILEEVKCGYSSSQREYEFDAMISSMTKRVLEIKEKEFKEFIKIKKMGKKNGILKKILWRKLINSQRNI